jgi:hypothetical protein
MREEKKRGNSPTNHFLFSSSRFILKKSDKSVWVYR